MGSRGSAPVLMIWMMISILFKIGKDEGLWLDREIPGQTVCGKRLAVVKTVTCFSRAARFLRRPLQQR